MEYKYSLASSKHVVILWVKRERSLELELLPMINFKVDLIKFGELVKPMTREESGKIKVMIAH